MTTYNTLYEDIKKQLTELIGLRENAKTKDEKALQLFFEEYPSALLSVLDGVDSQYAIFGNVIISQPKFKSFDGDRSPDFLIVSWNSMNFYFNYIEIEDPSKKIFAKTNQELTTDFTHSYNQLIQWSSFGKSEVEDYSIELLRTLFSQNHNNTSNKTLHYNYILLYGFSNEIEQLSERHNNILQKYFSATNMHHCTYSRLLRESTFRRKLFSVKKDPTTNKFKAIGFVPFKRYEYEEWSDFHNIIGKQDLIRKTSLLTDEEKDSLINQIDKLDKLSIEEIIKLNVSDTRIRNLTDFLDD